MTRDEQQQRSSKDITLKSTSPEETMQIAARLAVALQPGDVLALSGPLGAGKTCFVRGLAAGLGIDPRRVSSPTFVLVQEYETQRAGPVRTLIHVDAYRMAGGDEDLATVGWDEMINAPDAVLAIEWPDRLGDETWALAADRLCEVELSHDESDAHTRHVHLTCHDRLASAAQATLAGTQRKTIGGRQCPTCKRPVAPDSASFPFCSDRCRWADLGKWMDGDFRISRELTDDDELE